MRIGNRRKFTGDCKVSVRLAAYAGQFAWGLFDAAHASGSGFSLKVFQWSKPPHGLATNMP